MKQNAHAENHKIKFIGLNTRSSSARCADLQFISDWNFDALNFLVLFILFHQQNFYGIAKFKYYCRQSSLIKLVRNSEGSGLFTIRGDGCSFPESNKI
jgi:hypothetical protein